MQFDLYVPRAGFPLACDPKSAIVGSPARQWLEAREAKIDGRSERQIAPDSNLVIDFEGNRYNSQNMRTFADRAVHAAGRHREHYPTVARCVVPRKRLMHVATFDLEAEQVTMLGPDEVQALMRWLDVTHEQLQPELQGTSRRAVDAARALEPGVENPVPIQIVRSRFPLSDLR